MLFTVLLLTATFLLTFIFDILPSFPATPDFLQGISDNVLVIFGKAIYILGYIFGQHLFFGTLMIISAIMVAEPTYHLVMWILRKIPVLNMK